MLSDAGRNRRITLYSLGMGLVGWSVLIASTDWRTLAHPAGGETLRANLLPLVAFAALSVIVKRFGFHAARDVSHSLVGIVDLAAVFTFGPVLGAWVAALSGFAYLVLRGLRHHLLSWRFVAEQPWFSGGLKALIAFLCGHFYLVQRGVIAPTILTWRLLVPLLTTVVLWFALEQIAWGALAFLRNGRPGLARFLRHTLSYSVLVELLPLPLSIVIALAYVGLGVPAFMLLALALVASGAMIQRLTDSWARLEDRFRELTILNEFGRELVEAQLNVEQLCELIYTYCQKIVHAPIFLLELVHEERNQVDIAVLTKHGQRLPSQTLALTGTVKWMASQRRPFLSNNVLEEGLPFDPHLIGEMPRSLLILPLLAGPRLIGVLSVQSDRTHAFTPEQQNVLSSVANQAAMALSNAQAYHAEQRRAKQLMAIGQVSQRVASILDLEPLFAEVVRLIQETFRYGHVALFTVDPESGQVAFRASTSPAIQNQGFEVSKGEGIIGSVAQSGESILSNDVSLEPRFCFSAALEDTRAELAVPLRVEERIVGVLDIQSNVIDAFGQDDLFVLQTLAHQVAIAVEGARLYADRQEEAWTSTAMLQAAEAVRSLDSLDDILDAAVRITPMLVGVDRCSILLWSEQAEDFAFVRGYAMSSDLKPLLQAGHMRPGHMPLLDQLLADKTPILVEGQSNRHLIPAYLAKELEEGPLFALPLYAQAEVYGVMLVDYVGPGKRFSDRKQTILKGVADQVAMAVANAKLHTAQREEAWVSTALLQVAQAFVSSTELSENLSKIARLTTLLVGVDGCMIFVWDKARNELQPYVADGLTRELEDIFHGLHLPSSDMPLINHWMKQPSYVAIEKVTGSDLVPASLLYTFDIQALLALPLVSKGELLGALWVHYRQGPRQTDGETLPRQTDGETLPRQTDGETLPRRFSARNIAIVEGIAYQTSIAIENARLYEATLEQERMSQELRVAREIQASFLPQECPLLPGWELCADWHGARGVSGDFYDFIPLDEKHLGLVVADVSDKGVPAALFMSLSKTLVRVCAAQTLSPAKTLQRVNELMIAQTHTDMFLTLFYGVLNWRTGSLSYANAGHNPPILWRYGSKPVVQELKAKGIVLGVTEEVTLEERRVQLRSGDILILYTDGVTEPINEQEQEFGVTRLTEVIASHSDKPCQELVRSIHTAVFEFAGRQPQFDDYTLIAVKRPRPTNGEMEYLPRPTNGEMEYLPRPTNGETVPRPVDEETRQLRESDS